MKKHFGKLALLALALPLASCSFFKESELTPKGIDLSIYENSAYVTKNSTTYKVAGGQLISSLHASYRFAPTGVVFSESRLGKIAFNEVPYSSYYFDSETEIRMALGGDKVMHGHFFTNEENKRCFVLENYLQFTYIEA